MDKPENRQKMAINNVLRARERASVRLLEYGRLSVESIDFGSSAVL